MALTHEEMTFPADRRLRARIRRRELMIFAGLALAPAVAAWVYYAVAGLPTTAGRLDPAALEGPHGFPLWLRSAHYLNLLIMVLMIRSGLSILMDHPRLYWNVHCTPGSEWARFTPLQVPADRVWTAKDDARYISPWLALPGGRHTVGLARHWHFLLALLWTANGLIFVTLLVATGQWQRIVPHSWSIVSEAAAIFVHYATFHLPAEPDGFYQYNALQHLAYFAVVFVLPPLSILTGLAMSPAIDNQFQWYPRLFGGRQSARSIHFRLLLGYLGFITVHVAMVVVTGLARNMDHIVMGTDETGLPGLVLGGRRDRGHRPGVPRVELGLVAPAQGLAICRAAARRGADERDDRSARPTGPVPTGGYLSALLAQRDDADLQGVAPPGRRRLPRLPSPGPRPGGESGRALTG